MTIAEALEAIALAAADKLDSYVAAGILPIRSAYWVFEHYDNSHGGH
jgi:hypothetical protein